MANRDDHLFEQIPNEIQTIKTNFKHMRKKEEKFYVPAIGILIRIHKYDQILVVRLPRTI